jgi:multidrug efflux pump
MQHLINAFMDRSRSTLSVLVALLIAGIVAYISIPKEAEPDVKIPIIYVSVAFDGISPDDAERLLARPLEQELRSIEGVKEMRSLAAEGHASVTLEFEAGFDSEKALNDVRQKVDIAKAELPEEAREPTVHEVNLALFPVVAVMLSGNVPESSLIRAARALRDEVEGLPGVLDAEIAGDREEVLEISIDPVRIESYGLNLQDVVQVVTTNNRVVPAGALDTGAGRFSVKVPGLFKEPRDLLELPIKAQGDAVVRVMDVTTVRRTFKDRTTIARLNGQPAIAVEVSKRVGTNIVETIEKVRETTEALRVTWPPEITVSYVQDKSGFVRTMLGELENGFTFAMILVVAIIVAALGWRSSVMVGLAIPTSFLFGILVLSFAGLTINMVVLFSLILAVGMLVDDAIIVTEYADRRMAEGVNSHDAYREAATRMAWPVIAATVTKIAAFSPLLFMPGIVGEFMKYLPITLIATLTGSLIMALVFLPAIGGYFGKATREARENATAEAMLERGDIRRLRGATGVYVRVCDWSMRHAGLTVLLAIGLLVGINMAYSTWGKGVEFFPKVEPEEAVVYVHGRGNYSTIEKDALVREVEQRILPLNEFKSVYTRTGTMPQGKDIAADVIGFIQIEFAHWQSRRGADAILDDIRRRTADLAGIEVEATYPPAGPPTGKHIQLQLTSRFPDAIAPMAAKVKQKLVETPDIQDIEDGAPLPGIEWRMTVDRTQAGRFGADIASIGSVIQLVTNGIKVGEYRPDDADKEVDIRVRFPTSDRSIEQLDQLRVPTAAGSVPLSNFVQREAYQRTGILNRVGGQRVMTVKANVTPGVLPDSKVQELRSWLQAADIDPRVQWRFKGQDEEQQKIQSFMGKALAAAIAIMAIVLVTQFNSYFHVFLILTAVIMSTAGVMLGLLATGQAFSVVMNGIGVVALAGIVVNNNIILIDTYQHLRRQGMEEMEAILRTGAQRLRPVFLTSITGIAGLLPMILQVSLDFTTREYSIGGPTTQWWVQLSTSIGFGLAFATLLTLIVQPACLALGVRLSRWRSRRQAARAQHVANQDAPPREETARAAE